MSKNAAGIVVLVLSLFGAEVSESAIVELITAVTTAVSILLMVWNQLQRPDVKSFFLKK